jgi:hypothetical protein
MHDDIEKPLVPVDRKAALRIPLDRKDRAAHKEVLLCVMKLFGEGMHESPQQTMGLYLEATDGKCAESKLELWEKDRAGGLLCHKNAAERPFGVMKWLKKIYPSIAHAVVNGTHTTGGSASTAHGDLKAALRKLLCIRKATMGAITRMARDDRVKDTDRREEHISKHRQTAEQAALTKAQKRAVKVDTAREISQGAVQETHHGRARLHYNWQRMQKRKDREACDIKGRAKRRGVPFRSTRAHDCLRRQPRAPKDQRPKLSALLPLCAPLALPPTASMRK